MKDNEGNKIWHLYEEAIIATPRPLITTDPAILALITDLPKLSKITDTNDADYQKLAKYIGGAGQTDPDAKAMFYILSIQIQKKSNTMVGRVTNTAKSLLGTFAQI